MTRRWASCGLAAASALTVAGCAAQGVPISFDDASSYKCLNHTIEAEVLAAATPVADLTGDAATILGEAVWDDGRALSLDDDAGWFLAGSGDDGVLIMRRLAPAEMGMGGPPGSDREIIEVTRIEGASNAPDGWYVTSDSVCPLTIDLGDLTVPTVTLDPAHLPDPASPELQLLVTESECNSGQPANGRVEVASLTETDDSVAVTIGVKPSSGAADCQSNPATPFTVKLGAPLGDREIIDGTRGVPLTTP